MKVHYLTLTDEDGVVLERWCLEDDFGDISQPMPRMLLAQEIGEALEHEKD